MPISVTPSSPESRRLSTAEPSRKTVPREDTPPREWPVWALKMRHEYETRIARLEYEKAELEAAIVAARRAQREMNETALTLYGGSSALQEVTKQVSISPKFASLTPQEHEYVGRVALATGLNPEFHIHAWTAEVYDKERGGKVRKLFVTPDYKALIQLSRRDYLMLKERTLTADEMRARGIPERDIQEGSIAYLVEGYELDKAALAKQAGIDYQPLHGFGWWAAKKDDFAWNATERKMLPTGKRIDNDVPQGRDGAWVAWKRAIRALYNQIADLSIKFNRPMDLATDEDGDAWTFEAPTVPMVIEGEVADDAHQEAENEQRATALTQSEIDTLIQYAREIRPDLADVPRAHISNSCLKALGLRAWSDAYSGGLERAKEAVRKRALEKVAEAEPVAAEQPTEAEPPPAPAKRTPKRAAQQPMPEAAPDDQLGGVCADCGETTLRRAPDGAWRCEGCAAERAALNALAEQEADLPY